MVQFNSGGWKREGGQLHRPRDLLLPTFINREIFYLAEIFYISRVKNLGFW